MTQKHKDNRVSRLLRQGRDLDEIHRLLGSVLYECWTDGETTLIRRAI